MKDKMGLSKIQLFPKNAMKRKLVHYIIRYLKNVSKVVWMVKEKSSKDIQVNMRKLRVADLCLK
jgi:hypothetical protein